jgi:hypothetical protein
MDEVVFECVKINNGTRNDVFLKNKDSLFDIGILTRQPIFKCGKKYVVLEGQSTAYIYQEQ